MRDLNNLNYRMNRDFSGEDTEEVITLIDEDGTIRDVPADPGNTHYQEYLAWKAIGKTPLRSDQRIPGRPDLDLPERP